MKSFLYLLQILSSAGLIFLILSQSKGTGLASIFGGEGAVYRTKRGFEKTLHYVTVATSIIFVSAALFIVLFV